jgi:hypothetical protein
VYILLNIFVYYQNKKYHGTEVYIPKYFEKKKKNYFINAYVRLYVQLHNTYRILAVAVRD